MRLKRLRRFVPRREHRPIAVRAHADGISIRWLGTAGHVIEAAGTTVLIDPFLTRTPFRRLVAPLEPDLASIRRYIPPRVDAVLLGHSHYDHLLDAPTIARLTGARIVGSETTANFARAAGLSPDQIEVVPATGRTLRVGALEIQFVPSLHSRFVVGRVPFQGEVKAPPRLPAWAWQYRMGGAFGIAITVAGRCIYHNGSADLVDAALTGLHADVVLLGLAGRYATRDYVARICGALDPRVVLPTHHDTFFSPLSEGVRLLPGIRLSGFAAELRRLAPAARLITPTYEDRVVVPVDGDPRDAAVVV